MATNFPGSLDNSTSLPYPSAVDDTNSPSLAGGQDNQNDAVIAAQTKLGTGSTDQTPTVGTVLVGTATGKSGWSSISGAQTTGNTGTGNFVLANSPTISQPIIASPNISNPTFSGSLGSISVGSVTATGLITGNGGGTFASSLTLQSGGTLNLPDGAVSANALSTSAITLGYAEITTSFTTASDGYIQVTGLTANVVIPSGGRRIKITVFVRDLYNDTSGSYAFLSIWDGIVGSGAIVSQVQWQTAAGDQSAPATVIAVVTPPPGAKTYNVSLQRGSGGTAGLEAFPSSPAFILVEAI